MPDQNQTNNTAAPTPSDANDVIVSPDAPESIPTAPTTPAEKFAATVKSVANQVQAVHNILISLSSDPSVDEITAAIGLSLYLDRIGKRCTSIYSGQTPNILEFLQPEKTFETSSDVLRDFVIALNKNKADHLRYKLDGDYVKIFITPYKTRIDKDDFEFSLGDFNIELVLALNVASGIDLDDALREHGRVMHDATVINITNGNPGKFGDIEWNDKSKSSISEMAADLLYELGGKDSIMPDEATALLAGIVSATDHFSNNSTTANAMQISAKLMNSGANRELISENIGLDSQNMFFHTTERKPDAESSTLLDIDHDGETIDSQTEIVADLSGKSTSETNSEDNTENDTSAEPLPDLKAVIDDLAKAEAIAKPSTETSTETITETTTETTAETPSVSTDSPTVPPLVAPTDSATPTDPLLDPTDSALNTAPNLAQAPSESSNSSGKEKPEKTLTPPADFVAEETPTSTDKYGQMLEAALAEPDPQYTAPTAAPAFETTPVIPNIPTATNIPATPTIPTIPTASANQPAPTDPTYQSDVIVSTYPPEQTANPAYSASPAVASEPDINGVPQINYTAVSDDNILPPPPAPPIDLNSPMPTMPPAI